MSPQQGEIVQVPLHYIIHNEVRLHKSERLVFRTSEEWVKEHVAKISAVSYTKSAVVSYTFPCFTLKSTTYLIYTSQDDIKISAEINSLISGKMAFHSNSRNTAFLRDA